jgi:hypothetical protein
MVVMISRLSAANSVLAAVIGPNYFISCQLTIPTLSSQVKRQQPRPVICSSLKKMKINILKRNLTAIWLVMRLTLQPIRHPLPEVMAPFHCRQERVH